MRDQGQHTQDVLCLDTMVGDILAIVNCIQLLGETDVFRAWLAGHHGIEDHEDLLEGYKFALNVLLRRLHDAVAYSAALGLSEDVVFSRARFVGIPLEKLPNSCDKTVILKHMHFEAKKVLRARTWAGVGSQTRQFQKVVLAPFDELKSNSTVSARHRIADVDAAIALSSMFHAYIYLVDTSKGLPQGYFVSMLRNTVAEPLGHTSQHYLARAFRGYKYALQFLWFRLLGGEFGGTPLARLHESDDWRDLGNRFELVRNDVIRPREAQAGAVFPMESLVHRGACAPTSLACLLTFDAPRPTLSHKERLDQAFLWYPVEFVDASEANIFNGVATFASLLSGIVEMNKRVGEKDKTPVIKLTHPTDDPDLYHFSYGALVELRSYSGMSDYSGWMLFYDCCYNSGSGVEGLRFADQLISEFSQGGFVQLAEETVRREEFLELMKGRLLSVTKRQILDAVRTRDELKWANDRLATAAGLLLELLAYYAICGSSHGGNVKKAEWDYKHLQQQIDVLVRDQASLLFLECKKPLSDLCEQAVRLGEKAKVLLRDPQFRRTWEVHEPTDVRHMLLVWDRPEDSVIRALTQQGTEVMVLSEELYKHPSFTRKDKGRLETVFKREGIARGPFGDSDDIPVLHARAEELFEL